MAHAPSDQGDDASITTEQSSSAATDPLDDFLARYTFTYQPEYCVKLRRR